MKNYFEVALGALLIATLGAAVYFQPLSSKPKKAATDASSIQSETMVATNSFAIVNVRVFNGETALPKATVVVRDGLISEIDTAGKAKTADLERIDGSGKTLMPGLIDAHTHSWGNAQRDALRFGVTTELEMMGDASRFASNNAQRASLAPTEQADLWSAGAAVTVPGGHGTQFGLKVPTLDASTTPAKFVQARVLEGSDYIKLIVEDLSAYPGPKRWPTLDGAQIGDAITAAHAAEKMAVVHVSLMRSAAQVIEAGADGLVHVFADADADVAFVALAKQQNTFVVPTLTVLAGFAGTGEGSALANDPALRDLLSSEQRQSLTSKSFGVGRAEVMTRALANVRALHRGGVAILAGTDSGNPGTAHGASMHGELALLVQAGLTPEQALSAATAKAASVFSLADRGRIQVGLRADLVLVEGDPTQDIQATRNITHIWKNGYTVERSIISAKAPSVGDVPLIGSFESETITAPFGVWMSTTDQMAGGASTAEINRVVGGAKGSAGALHVRGAISASFAYPWSGAMFMAGDAMAPVDASSKRELVFQVRGDGREYRVMLFSGESAQGIPSMQPFKTTAQWQEVRIPLANFAGAELGTLRGFAWAADAPEGAFEVWLDEVELR